jgi:hypothetical protein
MSDPNPRRETLRQAIADLNWLVTIPHTLEHAIGVARETEAEERGLGRSGGAGRGAKGGHSDPTGDRALDTTAQDSAEVTRTLDAALSLVVEAAAELDREVAGVMGRGPVNPTHPMQDRHHLLNVAVNRCHRALDDLDAVARMAAEQGQGAWLNGVDFTIRTRLAETAAWMRAKCEIILGRSPSKAPAVQRKRNLCEGCQSDGYENAPTGSRKSCDRCIAFRKEHKVEPTKAVRRWWDEHPRTDTPPRLVIEAKAAAKDRRKRGSMAS